MVKLTGTHQISRAQLPTVVTVSSCLDEPELEPYGSSAQEPSEAPYSYQVAGNYYSSVMPMPLSLTSQQYINLAPFHIVKDGKFTGVNDIAIVDYLIQNIHFFVIKKRPFVYKEGVYIEDEKGTLLKTEIQKLIHPNFLKYEKKRSIYNLLIEQAAVQKQFVDVNQHPMHWINFKNGMFDVKTGKMLRHDPQYFSINQIPHELDLNLNYMDTAKYPHFHTFITYAIPNPEDKRMLFEFLGYCMTIDNRFQKFLVLNGMTDTGKTVIINLFKEIVGSGNYSPVSMHKLAERFYASQLRGKLLNCCGDISSRDLYSTDIIKMATGEDELTYEPKGVDGEGFKSYAKLLFSTNKVPRNAEEQSDAFYNRLLILPMNQQAQHKDLELLAKITHEIPYIILMAVCSLYNAYHAGSNHEGQLFESQHSKQLVHQLRKASDTALLFYEDCIIADQSSEVKTTAVYDAYKEYCHFMGEACIKRPDLYSALMDRNIIKKIINGREYFDGIKLVLPWQC
jgi:P4 family phage/plasmid primase-like protien